MASLASNLYWYLPVRLLARIQYPTAEYVARVHVPTLVIHSRDDETIPFLHGEELRRPQRARATSRDFRRSQRGVHAEQAEAHRGHAKLPRGALHLEGVRCAGSLNEAHGVWGRSRLSCASWSQPRDGKIPRKDNHGKCPVLVPFHGAQLPILPPFAALKKGDAAPDLSGEASLAGKCLCSSRSPMPGAAGRSSCTFIRRGFTAKVAMCRRMSLQ